MDRRTGRYASARRSRTIEKVGGTRSPSGTKRQCHEFQPAGRERMPDPARIAQAQVLEVPVIVQGAKTVEGTDRRELFTENAKTTLVFENGAVLNLRTKLTVGQVVFLHNEQNGREVLCNVIETPAEAEPGHTDLKFADVASDFWRTQSDQPEAAAEFPRPAENHATQEQPESPSANLEMMGAPASSATVPPRPTPPREELVAAHEVVPEASTPAEPVPDSEPSVPTGEEIDAAVRKISSASLPPDSKEPVQALRDQPAIAKPDLAQEKENRAPLTSSDASRVTPGKNSVQEKAARKSATPDSPETQTTGDALAEDEIVPPKVPLAQRLTTGKTAVVVQVATCLVIAISLLFIWRAVRGVFIHDNAPSVASVVQPRQNAPSAAASRPPAGSSPATTATSAKPPQVIVVRESPVRGTNVATTKPAVSEPNIKITESAPASAAPEIAENKDMSAIPDIATPSKHIKSNEANVPGLVPARILTQSQPALPPWAKGLEVDGVVTLDAVIDENGNAPASKMKVLSGPRLLQSSAKQTVQLWLFQPALSDGKPTATHMILTVEFQH